MAFLNWKNNYSVGVLELDQQHRRLIEIINELHSTMAAGNDRARLQKVMEQLTEYTIYHFRFEESLMQRHGYPNLAEHKRVHAAMEQRVAEFAQAISVTTGSYSIQLLDFLKQWLTRHILETDMKYKPFVDAA